MGNLFTAMQNTANSMRVFERAMSTVQNNVANVDTPGYAKQVLTLVAKPFDPGTGLSGGVDAGELVSYRSIYAEQSVRQQNQAYGNAAQAAEDLANIEPIFSVTDGSGISGALTAFFSAASSLSVAPNDASQRQVVLDRAGQLAQTFNQTASSLAAETRHVQTQVGDVTTQINALASTVRDINQQRRQNHDLIHDAGLDAQLNTALEDLSELVDFTALPQEDGSVTVLLGGQTPLVLGDKTHPVQADTSTGSIRILSDSGQDITGQVSGGRLNALIDLSGRVLPDLASRLDQIASTVGSAVNGVLKGGWDGTGNPPTTDLFTFDPAAAALTLTTNALKPQDLAVALPGAAGGNGNALKLAALGNSPLMSGYTVTQAYGELAGSAGRALSDAQSEESVHQSLLAQSRDMRAQQSSVNLDEEAARLMEYQRSYQAASKIFTVINDMLDSLMSIVH